MFKFKNFLCLILIVTTLFLTSCSCNSHIEEENNDLDNITNYAVEYYHPTYQSNLTVAEHKAEITKRTEEIFKKEIEDGDIVKYKVDILYSFYDDDPEYFLVDLEYKYDFESQYSYTVTVNLDDENKTEETRSVKVKVKTRYKHVIGMIINDTYILGLNLYDKGVATGGVKNAFILGESAYAFYGYDNKLYKKYYGNNCQAVLYNDNVMALCDMMCFENGIIENHKHTGNLGSGTCVAKSIINEKDYEYLMKNNQLHSMVEYDISE